MSSEISVMIKIGDVLNQVSIDEYIDFVGIDNVIKAVISRDPEIIDLAQEPNDAMYDQLVGLINDGILSLELIVGKIAVQSLIAKAEKVAENS